MITSSRNAGELNGVTDLLGDLIDSQEIFFI